MMKREKSRGKLISGYRGYFPCMGKSFPADTELQIRNYELRIIQDRFKNMIKLFNCRNMGQIRDAGLKTSVRDCGLAAGFVQSGIAFAI